MPKINKQLKSLFWKILCKLVFHWLTSKQIIQWARMRWPAIPDFHERNNIVLVTLGVSFFLETGIMSIYKNFLSQTWWHMPLIPSPREALAGRSLWVWGYPGEHGEFEASQGSIVRPCMGCVDHILPPKLRDHWQREEWRWSEPERVVLQGHGRVGCPCELTVIVKAQTRQKCPGEEPLAPSVGREIIRFCF